jgi:CheY-like chemotaxis protein
MDGAGLVSYLRQNPRTASIPIILTTSETSEEKLNAIRRLGAIVCDKSFPESVARSVIDRIA